MASSQPDTYCTCSAEDSMLFILLTVFQVYKAARISLCHVKSLQVDMPQ